MAFIQQRTCEVNLGYSTEICEDLHHHRKAEKAVQVATSHLFMYQSLLGKVPSLLFLLYLGKNTGRAKKKKGNNNFLGSLVSNCIYHFYPLLDIVYHWADSIFRAYSTDVFFG